MKERGFTLIEVLVIISILGLISSVALANFQGARERAKRAASYLFQGSVNSALGDRLESSWNFDDGEIGAPATAILDSSGNNRNGTVVGNATYVAGVNELPAILLNNGTYIIGTGLESGPNAPITVAVWASPTSVINNPNIFRIGSAACTGLGLGISSGNLLAVVISELDAPKILVVTEAAVKNNVWQFVVWSFDEAGNLRIYLDGALLRTEPNFGTAGCSGTDQWAIGGAFPNSDVDFNGKIDNVTVYSGSLSALEVAQLYKEGLEARGVVAH